MATKVKVKILLNRPGAVVPAYKTEGAAAFDFVAPEDFSIEPGETKILKTGLMLAIPAGFELQVRPRSGVSLNTTLIVKNSPGTIDSDYRGEIGILFHNLSTTDTVEFNAGERVAQGALCPVYQAEFEVVDELDKTGRGAGGYGSTGK